ncbi:hypothetical protein [Mycobacterium malmoense]|uniref:hypothetical protein n=1 Tax=Mycobacterium malmoense TaxID=1780 RepID=UPI00111C27C4|nr:hypothetical protein [Mycobacterium malmoense]UNB92747.1 hypothetical protein H5T25_14400 [Mycobacterium malmoense]
MDLAARPTVTAAAALASAAVLAVGPMAQHLPNLHLPAVSISGIQLTDASSAMVDLFAGVETELSSFASGATAAATVPSSLLTDVVTPFQTWINAFSLAGTNLQYILNQWSAVPFPVLQQVAANGVDYASEYVSALQQVALYPATWLPTWGPAVQSGLADIAAGNVATGVFDLYQNLIQEPFAFGVGELLGTLQIPVQITQNIANATNYAVNHGVVTLGQYGTTTLWTESVHGLATGLQTVYDSWTAGDLAGTVSNLANVPGLIGNAFLNGFQPSLTRPMTGGLLSSNAIPLGTGNQTGFLNQLLNGVDPGLANAIVAPNAQNIVGGGSLMTAIQNLGNQLINGWPSFNAAISSITSDISGTLTSMLQSLPSVLSSLPSTLGTIATQLGTMIINLLKML